jgi:hypothetical protein
MTGARRHKIKLKTRTTTIAEGFILSFVFSGFLLKECTIPHPISQIT